jgi:LemA protein
MKKIILGSLATIALIIISTVMWYISTGNELIALDEGVSSSWGQVENVYQRRADLIPNLVNTVKGYAAHEKQTLDAVISARASATRPNLPMDERLQAESGLGAALGRLLAVAEAYPDLKANQNFLQLQGELSQIENRIAGARGGYNGAAEGYNAMARQFPTLVVARLFGFHDMPFFQVDDPAQRNAPVVRF